MLIVLSGRPTLLMTARSRELEPGEVLSFRAVTEGAHRIDNEAEEPARVLIVSTMKSPEFTAMIESGHFCSGLRPR